MYIVSACLLGIECKYNGGHNRNDRVLEFLSDKKYKAICPETQGGLKSPRNPSEIVGDKVLSSEGEDLTEAFRRGAEEAWKTAMDASESEAELIEAAILMPRSPSCGIGAVYDGSFSGNLIEGDGIAAALFRANGVKLLMPDDL